MDDVGVYLSGLLSQRRMFFLRGDSTKRHEITEQSINNAQYRHNILIEWYGGGLLIKSANGICRM